MLKIRNNLNFFYIMCQLWNPVHAVRDDKWKTISLLYLLVIKYYLLGVLFFITEYESNGITMAFEMAL